MIRVQHHVSGSFGSQSFHESYITTAEKMHVYFHVSGAPQDVKTSCKTKFPNSHTFILSYNKSKKIKSRGGSSVR